MKLSLLNAIILSLALIPALSAGEPNAVSREHFSRSVQPLLKRFCFECHGPEKQKSQIRYDRIEHYRAEDQRLWAMAHEQILTGEMPPEDKTQPTADEKKALLSWIEQQSLAARKNGGGSTRRLNKRELSAALQDLIGTTVDYSDSLPGDGKVAGFDTGADGLQDAADSITQVMKITRGVVDAIQFLEKAPPNIFEMNLRDAADPRKFDVWKPRGVTVNTKNGKKGLGVLIEPQWVGDRDSTSFMLPVPADRGGVVRVKLTISAMKAYPEIPNSMLWVEVGGKSIAFKEITGTFDAPEVLVFEVQMDELAIEAKGLRLSLSNKIEIPYAIEGFENDDNSKPEDNIQGGIGKYRPRYDRKTVPLEKQPVPHLVLQRIEIDPDYVTTWPPAHWKAKSGEIADNLDSAKRLLRIWTERAFRRPVTDAEEIPFIALYEKLRKQGATFDDALRAAFQSALLSSGFRYLSSTTDPNPVIAQHAIASRLSFMLWGAPPDEELRRLAAANKLNEPATLDAQVDRLVADPRSEAFFHPFVMQWLEMEQPITVAMDHIKKQDFRFGRNLKASMREETIRYIAQLFIENRPASEMIDSDWTMMNNILAIHNGYPAMKSGQLMKVKLRPDDPRGGGILGHAGIQSMLCWMGENWVIYRGAWALRHILDDTLPPPPLEVPELNPSENENKGKPFRELLKQHQADANCAICHWKMDPLGFAFQNFDISGRWRNIEYDSYAKSELDGKIAWLGAGNSRPVDAVGKLPRGETFKTYPEFKTLLAKNYSDDLVRGMMKRLVIYAAGRQPDIQDMAEIRKILAAQKASGFPLRDVLKSVLKFCWKQ